MSQNFLHSYAHVGKKIPDKLPKFPFPLYKIIKFINSLLTRTYLSKNLQIIYKLRFQNIAMNDK